MIKTLYRIPSVRGANVVDANPQRIESVDGSRWACGRNVKRALADHRWDVVEVWTLKHRVDGKAKIFASNCTREQAEKFIA